jgi:hypothetical protein
MVWSFRALAAIAMAAMLAACGPAGNQAGAAGQSQQDRDMRPAHKPGDTLDPDMVTAVNSAHSTTPISIKFRVSARPVVGTPLTIVLALVPAENVGISHIHASFQPGDGLQLQGERTLDINDPGAGVIIEQELSVVPQQPGVLSLNATIVVDLDGGSLARSYSIPLIASDNPSQSHSP